MLARVIRVTNPMPTVASTTAGSTMWLAASPNRSGRPRSRLSIRYIPVTGSGGEAPAVSRPGGGAQPRRKYTVETSSTANQNVGMATPIVDTPRAAASIAESRVTDASTPSAMPTASAASSATVASSAVAGSERASSVRTGRLVAIDVPRSPRSRLPT